MALRNGIVWLLMACVVALPGATPSQAQFDPALVPIFSIWDVKLGQPVSQIPDMEVVDIACGTNGGPPAQMIGTFANFAKCAPEPSGLHEIYFANDDEIDYIAKAMESEYKVLQGGTSIYAHPVIVSVLVDDGGIVRGIRVVTDERASLRERRVAVTLARNLKGRYGSWKQTCENIPLRPGENRVGNQFEHELCTADNTEIGQRMRLESSYLRKKGQEALNTETQQVNQGYFQSQTRLEVVEAPYEPVKPPA
ncbi:MAG: hypothetical protein JWR51_3380 [Devosia sp.]|uniref:hypothetical protein n=1 Tax=Devosia sp. TaxID=1871048 RepID=UPI002635059E|nr:hypothetical protein [Devosia sp.]MDB5530277.1 hypothetical protein [Devosia sp.]